MAWILNGLLALMVLVQPLQWMEGAPETTYSSYAEADSDGGAKSHHHLGTEETDDVESDHEAPVEALATKTHNTEGPPRLDSPLSDHPPFKCNAVGLLLTSPSRGSPADSLVLA